MPSREEPLVTAAGADPEECSDCGPPPEEPAGGAGDSVDKNVEPMTLCQFLGAIGVLCLSLPAIIGACCWPMVVAALLNVSASFMNGGAGTGLVDFFHGFQVALMMTVMFNLTQFVWWRCKQSRRGTCLQVHAPTLWTLAATILVNIQPLWILIIGSWHLCCSTNEQLNASGTLPTNWNPGGYSFPPWSSGDPRPCKSPGGNVFWDVSYCGGKRLSTFPTVGTGWAVQIIFTWGGFVCMFIGVMMATQLHVKLRKQWRSARAGR